MVLLLGGGGVNWMMENQQCGKGKQGEEQEDKAKWDKAKKKKRMKTD